jgi:prophage regulatory protein
MQSPSKQFLRLPGVRAVVPLSRSEIYRRMRAGQFPKQIKLGPRTAVWDADEIQKYVHDAISAAA